MTIQYETIRKILDAAVADGGRLEDAVEELEKFAMLRSCDFLKYTEHCMAQADWMDSNGEFKPLEQVYGEYKDKSKSI